MSDNPQHDEAESARERALRLEAQLAAVTARVFQLEREVAAMRGVPLSSGPASASAPAPAMRTMMRAGDRAGDAERGSGTPAAATSPQATAPTVREGPAPAGERSLESRVGSQWFNRIGIVAVLIGVAWFLKFAFDSRWAGALGRVLIGLACGVALVAWSERFRAKGFAGFSYSLKALGSGVLYLSLWAAVSVYHLISPGVGFAGMIAVTAANGFVAWVQDAELLAFYAIVGAFATPLLLSSGRDEEVFLFSYLLLMNAAMLTLLVLKGWSRLLVFAFIGTVGLYWGWYWTYYAAAALGTTTLFLLLFFLLFAAATMLARQRTQGPHTTPHGEVARLLVSLSNAAFVFLGFCAMLSGHGRTSDTQLAWCAVGCAAFYLGLWRLAKRWLPASLGLALLADAHLAIAIVFVTLAIPLAVHGSRLTVGWLAEGTALLWLVTRTPSLVMRVLAAGALVLGLCSLAVDATKGQTQVIWNARFLSFSVAIAAMAIAGWLARRAAEQQKTGAGAAIGWQRVALLSEIMAGLLVVIAGVFEIHTWWWRHPIGPAVGWQAYPGASRERDMAAQFTYSAWFLLVSVVALAAGFRRRSALLRWEGLSLLAVTIVKVFLVDTSQLSQGYRIVSFLLLGVLLLGVSFAYQKDWLRLRLE